MHHEEQPVRDSRDAGSLALPQESEKFTDALAEVAALISDESFGDMPRMDNGRPAGAAYYKPFQ